MRLLLHLDKSIGIQRGCNRVGRPWRVRPGPTLLFGAAKGTQISQLDVLKHPKGRNQLLHLTTFFFSFIPAAESTTEHTHHDKHREKSSGNLWRVPEILSPGTTPKSRRVRVSSLSRFLKYLFMEPNKLKSILLLQFNLKFRWEHGKCS